MSTLLIDVYIYIYVRLSIIIYNVFWEPNCIYLLALRVVFLCSPHSIWRRRSKRCLLLFLFFAFSFFFFLSSPAQVVVCVCVLFASLHLLLFLVVVLLLCAVQLRLLARIHSQEGWVGGAVAVAVVVATVAATCSSFLASALSGQASKQLNHLQESSRNWCGFLSGSARKVRSSP